MNDDSTAPAAELQTETERAATGAESRPATPDEEALVDGVAEAEAADRAAAS